MVLRRPQEPRPRASVLPLTVILRHARVPDPSRGSERPRGGGDERRRGRPRGRERAAARVRERARAAVA
eukprot:29225-Pelagococcus_subviridis.AAC.2